MSVALFTHNIAQSASKTEITMFLLHMKYANIKCRKTESRIKKVKHPRQS